MKEHRPLLQEPGGARLSQETIGRLMQRNSGFTLLELMIVIAVIAVIAAIAIPNLVSARQTANERAAMATLRSISSAQTQFQASAKADEDNDGTGEFGGLGELSGVVPVRGGSLKVPTDLSGAFRNVSAVGEVARAGYCFRMYLPLPDGTGQGENPGGGYPAGMLGEDLAEVIWCVYAWPANRGRTGQKVFFVNQMGDISMSSNCDASGAATPLLTAGSAFLGGDGTHITGHMAIGTVGQDGSFWRSVN
jgi:prepilin-type N-terminal cleavage/methylation domain-containing protein